MEADVRFPVMGTDAHVLVHGRDVAALAGAARDDLHELERLWSRFLPDSAAGRGVAGDGRAHCTDSRTAFAVMVLASVVTCVGLLTAVRLGRAMGVSPTPARVPVATVRRSQP